MTVKMGLSNLAVINPGQVRQRVFHQGMPLYLPVQPRPHPPGGQASQEIEAAHHDQLYQHVPDQDVGKEIILGQEPHGQKMIEPHGITHHGLRHHLLRII